MVACASVPSIAFAQEQTAPVAAADSQSAQPLAPVTVRGKRPRVNRDRLTREELALKPSATLFDIVMTQRAQWMRGPATARSTSGVMPSQSSRPCGAPVAFGQTAEDKPCTSVVAGTLAGTVVYLDGRHLGEMTILRTMPVETAEKMCYYTMNQAQGRFGMAVKSPVVAVFSRGSPMAEDAC
jgi:hypothetical protein